LKAVEWHSQYADLIIQLAKEAVQTGWPIARPMFWLSPNDKKTYAIGDQFVLGDKVVRFYFSQNVQYAPMHSN
jgi:alpha-glucosidase (family GH31 glycosyl hydrolase)